MTCLFAGDAAVLIFFTASPKLPVNIALQPGGAVPDGAIVLVTA